MEIKEIQELIKKEREKNNITLEELSSKLKTTKAVIYNVENNEKFIEKNKPYSLYLLKAICNELNIKIEEENKNKENFELPKPQNNTVKDQKYLSSIKEKIFNIFKLSFLSLALFSIFIYQYFTNNNVKLNNEEEIASYSYEIPVYKENTKSYLSRQQNSLNNIYIISKNQTWISANIDGKDKVYNLTKNKKINITFKNKIHFITIGNASDIIIYYKGKKVTFQNKKLIHHIFVDNTGIFKNGYNILGKKS